MGDSYRNSMGASESGWTKILSDEPVSNDYHSHPIKESWFSDLEVHVDEQGMEYFKVKNVSPNVSMVPK